jgi:hypothetical protein
MTSDTKLCSDIAIHAFSPSPVPNWERGADRRGEGSTIFDCNLVVVGSQRKCSYSRETVLCKAVLSQN